MYKFLIKMVLDSVETRYILQEADTGTEAMREANKNLALAMPNRRITYEIVLSRFGDVDGDTFNIGAKANEI